MKIYPEGFYVYYLKDQGVPFYVGYGSGRRALVHFQTRNCFSELNTAKARKIRKLTKAGREIEYEFIPCSSRDEARALEKTIIEKLGRRNIDKAGILLNRAEGGCGSTLTKEEWKVINNSKPKWKDYSLEKQNIIKERIKQTKIRNGTYRKPHTYATSSKNKERLNEFNVSRRKKVHQYSLDGTFMNEYESCLAASKALMLNSSGTLSTACAGTLGKHKHRFHNFNWYYA